MQYERMNENELYSQVCLHIQGVCYSERSYAVLQNDSKRTRTHIIKNNIQIGNVYWQKHNI